MSLQHIMAFPAVFGILALNTPQPLIAQPHEALSVETIETEEVVTTVEAEDEANTDEVDEPVKTSETPEESGFKPAIVESTGWVHYTQDEVRLHPNLEPICKCEAGKQFHNDGSVIRGVVNPQDIGMCQINLKYHGDAADELGYDLFTEVGNIRYANHLYAQQGAQPWFWSKPCHGIS